jgi:hypothetical protein
MNSEALLLTTAALSSPVTAAKLIKNEAELDGSPFEGLSYPHILLGVAEESWSHVTSKINF